MKALAHWAMQSRHQSIIATTACLAIPLFFWLGAALLALTVLRHGVSASKPVLAVALLPALGWLAVGDPAPLIAALGAGALAMQLRQSVRLDHTLILAAALGLGLYWLLPLVMPDVLTAVTTEVVKMLKQALTSQPELLVQMQPLLPNMVQGLVAAIHLLMIVLTLLLGRYWQSELFNPQGFGQEFKQLRLPPAYSIIALAWLLGVAGVTPELAGMAPVLSVPMMFAGLALLHSLASKKARSGWMIPVYVGLFVFGPYIFTLLIFLALLDSLFNLRTRLKNDTV